MWRVVFTRRDGSFQALIPHAIDFLDHHLKLLPLSYRNFLTCEVGFFFFPLSVSEMTFAADCENSQFRQNDNNKMCFLHLIV